MDVLVFHKKQEAEETCSFELVHPNGDELPMFSAGSHVLVQVSESITRSYSLFGNPNESHCYRIAVLRDRNSRGGSIAMHEQVEPGRILRISAPINHFPLVEGPEHSLLLAGGIGVTPLLCMAEQLTNEGASFELHYCNRSQKTVALRKELSSARFAQRVSMHFDDGPAAQSLDIQAILSGCPAGTHLYGCGPKGFIDFITSAARVKGWPDASIHYELFAGNTVSHETDGSFEVQIASSGQIVTVPSDKTVVEALAQAGVTIETSCEQGVCGVCLTRILEGLPEHKDMFLSDNEQLLNDQFTPCCSRAKSGRLVLDL